jgi:ribosomal protein S18 acetylase RimI-like enzyme
MARRGRITSVFTIREYNDSDEPALIELMRELQNAELPLYEHLKPADDIGVWYIGLLKKQCRELDGVILIAHDGKKHLGAAVLFTSVHEKGEEDEMPHTYAHVSELVVAASARGRGIATSLLDECERRSKTAGRSELYLSVLAENRTARRVYNRAGYSDLKLNMRKKLK